MMRIPPFNDRFVFPGSSGPSVPNNAIKLTNCDFSANNIVSLPAMTELDTSAGGSLTFSYWHKVSTYPTGGVGQVYTFSKTNATFDPAVYWYNFIGPSVGDTEWNPSLTTNSGANVGFDSNITGDMSNWHNFAFTVLSSGVSSVVTGYVDGTLFHSSSIPLDFIAGSPDNFLQLFGLGGDFPSDSDPCVAYLADFRIYTSILSGANISALAAKTDVTTTLAHRYKFMNNGNDSVGTAHGTVGSELTYVPGPPGLPA